MPAVSSVQKNTKVIAAADGVSVTQAITAVDLTRSIVMFSYSDSDAAVRDLRDDFNVYLSDASTLTFERNSASFAATSTIEWTVVEFAPGVLASLQVGVLDPTVVQLDTTISAVNLGSTFPILSCSTNLSGARSNYPRPSFPTSTTFRLDFKSAPAAGNYKTRYQIVEFASTDAAVQSGLIHNDATTYDSTATITAVDLTKTMVIGFGNGGSTSGVNGNWQTYLQDSTTVYTTQSQNGSKVPYDLQYFVIQMLDGSRVESGNATIAAGATSPAAAPTWAAMTNGAMFAASPLDNASLAAAGNTQDISFSLAMNVGQDGVAISRGGTTGAASVTYYAVDWAAAASGTTYFQALTATATSAATIRQSAAKTLGAVPGSAATRTSAIASTVSTTAPATAVIRRKTARITRAVAATTAGLHTVVGKLVSSTAGAAARAVRAVSATVRASAASSAGIFTAGTRYFRSLVATVSALPAIGNAVRRRRALLATSLAAATERRVFGLRLYAVVATMAVRRRRIAARHVAMGAAVAGLYRLRYSVLAAQARSAALIAAVKHVFSLVRPSLARTITALERVLHFIVAPSRWHITVAPRTWHFICEASMIYKTDLKRPGEKLVVSLNIARQLAINGDQIMAVTTDIALESGSDNGASFAKSGNAGFNGTVISQAVIGGLTGNVYLMRFSVTTPLQDLEFVVRIPVSDEGVFV